MRLENRPLLRPVFLPRRLYTKKAWIVGEIANAIMILTNLHEHRDDQRNISADVVSQKIDGRSDNPTHSVEQARTFSVCTLHEPICAVRTSEHHIHGSCQDAIPLARYAVGTPWYKAVDDRPSFWARFVKTHQDTLVYVLEHLLQNRNKVVPGQMHG